MSPTYLPSVFSEYRKQYVKILTNIYPAKNSTGFPERNLSVNFISGYEATLPKEQENIFSWYEFQFGEKSNRHVDAILFNRARKELFIIESKRYSNPDKKIEEVKRDIDRIHSLVRELENEHGSRISLSDYANIYGVILADAWESNGTKKEIIQSYREETFCGKYLNRPDLHPFYDVESFDFRRDFGIENTENYSLLSFVWKIKESFPTASP